MARLTLAVFATALASAGASAQTAPKAAGHWQGTIHMGANEVPMNVDLAKNAAGAWIGTFTVPGSGQADIPLTDIPASDSTLRFSIVVQERATFEGKFSSEGNSIAGTASNSQGSVQFDLARSGDAKVNVPPPSTAVPKEFEGKWEGAISVNGTTLRLGMKLSTSADGKAAAMLTSIDQGGQEFPASTVTVDGKQLVLEAGAIGASYKGMLGGNGEITGNWTQGTEILPLNFKRTP